MTNASRLNDYPLFRDISEKNLQILLPCINARLQPLPAGSSLEQTEGSDVFAMLLSGRILLTAAPTDRPENTCGPSQCRMLCEGDLLPHDFTGRLLAQTDTLLLKMDADMVLSPCWFSCAFHHRLRMNLLQSCLPPSGG